MGRQTYFRQIQDIGAVLSGDVIQYLKHLYSGIGPPLFVSIYTVYPEPIEGGRAGCLTAGPMWQKGRGNVQKEIPLLILRPFPYSTQVKCSIESTGRH